jgi:hypothetical protein
LKGSVYVCVWRGGKGGGVCVRGRGRSVMCVGGAGGGESNT